MPDWGLRAERLLTQALADVRDSHDAIPTVTAALTALRIEAGEVLAEAMDGYPFPSEEVDVATCICPRDLVARGGFTAGCLVHAW